MPNHITNLLEVSHYDFTNKADNHQILDAFIELVKSEHRDFDLEKVIPMPKELNITSGSITNQAKALFDDKEALYLLSYSRYSHLRGIQELRQYINETEPDTVAHSLKIKSNIEKYGHEDWYSWSVNTWGTKWNTYDGYSKRTSDNEVQYKFDTAWSPPLPVIDVLAKKFPELSFKLQYIDEGDNIVHRVYWSDGKQDRDEEEYDEDSED
jgi:hypothetical protein